VDLKKIHIKHWLGIFASFLAGQGSVQVINLITGFFLLRWMSIDDFAQLSVVLGFQTTVGTLIDVGFSSSITALVGERFRDKAIVGTYIKAARKFRNKSFSVIIPLAGIAFHLIAAKHKWLWYEEVLLFGSIVASLFFQGWVACYSQPLLMHRQISEYYRPQFIGSVSRFVIVYILYIGSALSAWVNAWISTGVIVINGLFYRYNATKFIITPEKNDAHISSEMFSYISPLLPNIVFIAFQGQISLLIITFFGQTKSIAEVAALGRLGQVFVLLGGFNGIVIEPYIAQLDRKVLPQRYFLILSVGIFISSIICTIGFAFPLPLLWLLGSKYQDLQLEVGWVVAGACLNYIGGIMWTMHSARKWIYWWVSFAYIGIMLLVQVICLAIMDLHTTIGVVHFSFISTAAAILISISNAIFGFIYGPKIKPAITSGNK
jgi:O-antigen/teichoic acid export membrane protein